VLNDLNDYGLLGFFDKTRKGLDQKWSEFAAVKRIPKDLLIDQPSCLLARLPGLELSESPDSESIDGQAVSVPPCHYTGLSLIGFVGDEPFEASAGHL
jgi:hypothetical protein